MSQREKQGFFQRFISGASSAFVPLSVLATAILYFTGNSYLSAKAIGLGLAAAPSSISFQETMALGGSLLATLKGLLLALAVVISFLIMNEVIELLIRRVIQPPEMIESWRKQASEVQSSWTATAKKLKVMRKSLKAGTLTDDAIAQVEEDAEAHRANLASLNIEMGRRAFYVEIARAAALIMPIGLLTGALISFGRVEGTVEADNIRKSLTGPCKSCVVFSQGDQTIRGVLAFNDQQGLVIAHKGGLVLLPSSAAVKITQVEPDSTKVPTRRNNPSAKNQTTTGK